MSDVFVRKEEATHSGDPLTGTVHVDRDFGKGPWVRQSREAVDQFRCKFWCDYWKLALLRSILGRFRCCASSAAMCMHFSSIVHCL